MHRVPPKPIVRPVMKSITYTIPEKILHEAKARQFVDLGDEKRPKGAKSRNHDLCIMFFHYLSTHPELSETGQRRMRDIGLQLLAGKDVSEHDHFISLIVDSINNTEL
jgi:hypothetical protein